MSIRTRQWRKRSSNRLTRPTRFSAIRRSERNMMSLERIGISREGFNRLRGGVNNSQGAASIATEQETVESSLSSAGPGSAIFLRRFLEGLGEDRAVQDLADVRLDLSAAVTSRPTSWLHSKKLCTD